MACEDDLYKPAQDDSTGYYDGRALDLGQGLRADKSEHVGGFDRLHEGNVTEHAHYLKDGTGQVGSKL